MQGMRYARWKILGVMHRHDERDSAGHQSAQQFTHQVALLGIQTGQRLIQQQQPWRAAIARANKARRI